MTGHTVSEGFENLQALREHYRDDEAIVKGVRQKLGLKDEVSDADLFRMCYRKYYGAGYEGGADEAYRTYLRTGEITLMVARPLLKGYIPQIEPA